MREIIERDVLQIEVAATHRSDTTLYVQPHLGVVKFFTDDFGTWFKFNTANTRRHVVMPISRLLAVEYGHPASME